MVSEEAINALWESVGELVLAATAEVDQRPRIRNLQSGLNPSENVEAFYATMVGVTYFGSVERGSKEKLVQGRAQTSGVQWGD